jgi:hypothetical protein
MKITFNGHQQTERQTELSQKELHILFDVMKKKFLDHIEFGTYDRCTYNTENKKIVELCETHNVDVAYTKDRLAFFTSIVEEIENPYD